MTERELFLALLDLPDAAARSAFLDKACAGDAALRAQVETLFQSHDAAGSFLGQPALPPAPPDPGATQELGAPSVSDDRADAEGGDLSFLAASTRPDSLGRIGHYEVLQILGRGGFGIVFRAFDEVLQRVVALKVLAPAIAAASPARKRFLREARSSAQVRHENVVQAYEVGEQPLPYIAMEFIPGETLQQRLDRTGPLEAPEIVCLGRQIAEGLAAAHATGLIHRDIKPGNILVEGGQQRVKITDFGLARAADDASLTQSGMLAGTPMYMAPEQAKGETLDHRADLFSLGSVLYVMATGRPPFRASTSFAVLKRVVEDAPRPIREVIPEAPEWMCRIVEKLHAKDPAERFQSAREAADVLADCEKQLQAHKELQDFSRIPGGKPAPRRRRLWRVAAAVGLFALLIWGAMSFGQAAYLYMANRGAVEFAPDPDVLGFDLLPGVTGDVAAPQPVEGKPHTLSLSPGAYRIEARCKPGRAVATWEVTTHGWLSSRTQAFDGERVLIAVARGERLSLRPVLRDAPPSPNSDAGFVPLFNGKDLTGWKTRPGKPGDWQVIDGILVGSRDTECLFSARDDYQNFHLRAEVSVSRGGHGDIWFRAETPPEPPNFNRKEIGYTAQIDLTGDISFWNPQTNSWTTHGTPDIVKPDEWYTLEVIAAGNHLGAKVNGVTAVDFVEPLNAYQKGHIALQVRKPDTVVKFRKIEIKELPPNPPAQATPPPAIAPFTDADVQRIAALPAAEQIEEVRKELMRRNPGFDGTFKPGIVDGVVTAVRVEGKLLRDISPIRAFVGLKNLDCWYAQDLSDLSPLKEMPLTELRCFGADVSDLSPLKGMKLTFLSVGQSPLKDLSPLKGMQSLRDLRCAVTAVSDLSSLAGLPLTKLACRDTKVSDLAPVQGMPLKILEINNTRITDLTPLQGVTLEDIRLTPKNITRGLDILRGMKSLKTIGVDWNQSWPAAEFWERYDKGEFGLAQFTDADVQRIAALPAAEQVEEVRQELMRRNAGFDGKMDCKIEDGVVTGFKIVTDQVTDIAPIRVWSALRLLECRGTYNDEPNGLLADLTPLKGMNLAGLRHLDLNNTKVGDAALANFKDCKDLTSLDLGSTRVSDAGLIHFKDCKALTVLHLYWTNVGDAGLVHFQDCKDLTDLNLAGTKVSDVGLAHFKGMPLKELAIDSTGITDLTPLQGMPLEDIRLTPKNITRGLDILRDMKSLKTIGISWPQAWPAAEFWERYDKGEFKE